MTSAGTASCPTRRSRSSRSRRIAPEKYRAREQYTERFRTEVTRGTRQYATEIEIAMSLRGPGRAASFERAHAAGVGSRRSVLCHAAVASYDEVKADVGAVRSYQYRRIALVGDDVAVRRRRRSRRVRAAPRRGACVGRGPPVCRRRARAAADLARAVHAGGGAARNRSSPALEAGPAGAASRDRRGDGRGRRVRRTARTRSGRSCRTSTTTSFACGFTSGSRSRRIGAATSPTRSTMPPRASVGAAARRAPLRGHAALGRIRGASDMHRRLSKLPGVTPKRSRTRPSSAATASYRAWGRVTLYELAAERGDDARASPPRAAPSMRSRCPSNIANAFRPASPTRCGSLGAREFATARNVLVVLKDTVGRHRRRARALPGAHRALVARAARRRCGSAVQPASDLGSARPERHLAAHELRYHRLGARARIARGRDRRRRRARPARRRGAVSSRRQRGHRARWRSARDTPPESAADQHPRLRPVSRRSASRNSTAARRPVR